MRRPALSTTCALALLCLGFLNGCKKDNPGGQEERKDNGSPSSALAESQKKLTAIGEISTQQSELKDRIDKTKANVARLGNKTRKRLKPKLEALDSLGREVSESVGRLKGLNEPEFSVELSKAKTSLDSAGAVLLAMKKYLK